MPLLCFKNNYIAGTGSLIEFHSLDGLANLPGLSSLETPNINTPVMFIGTKWFIYEEPTLNSNEADQQAREDAELAYYYDPCSKNAQDILYAQIYGGKREIKDSPLLNEMTRLFVAVMNYPTTKKYCLVYEFLDSDKNKRFPVDHFLFSQDGNKPTERDFYNWYLESSMYISANIKLIR